MKNKGVFLVIILIVIVGVFVTVGTRQFVLEQKKQLPAASLGAQSFASAYSLPEGSKTGREAAPLPPPSEDGAEGAPVREAAPPPSEGRAEGAPAREAAPPPPQEEGLTQAPAAGRGRAAAAPPISPVTGSAANPQTDSSALTSEEYKKRLDAVDEQIQKMRESGLVPNTDTYRNMAEYEYRLWDKELNAIYNDILKGMTEDEARNLRNEERSWMKKRDETAQQTASKHKGGSIETTEYTASLAESSRARAYQLLNNYGDYLP